ncbi:hypothetical protein Prudu_1455S000400 [Prunus dulcis]|uniref:DUF4218 domain-containing protein n=1 Tax=Prunus dulcis TaxID=3755 RepID=A0A5H2YGH3_PRUDU|nr:hypothetical protein Prudu_1455S000400 [Prunus dulcis]
MVDNRTCPEGCIAERYIAEEAVEFCTEHLSDVNSWSAFKPEDGSFEAIIRLHSTSICLGEYGGSPTLYREHMIHIKTTYPKFRKRTKWLQDKHNSTFIQWLHFKVQSELNGKSIMAYQKI